MALPLLFVLGGTLLRAAGPSIAKQLVKMGAKKATGKAAQGAAKTVNSNNIGMIKTIARPKAGGAASKTTPKTAAPKTTTPKKPAPKTAAKKTAPAKGKTPAKKTAPKKSTEVRANPKDAPAAVKKRVQSAAAKKKAATKKDPLGTKTQRGLIAVATTAPMLASNNKSDSGKAKAKTSDMSNRANSKGGRGIGEGTKSSGKSFSQAFKEAYGKGVGTKFTHGGKSYSAVRDSDLKKAGVKTLREYLNKKKK